MADRPWEGCLTAEGIWTGDRRMIVPYASTWVDPPLPLKWTPADSEGHLGSVIVGSIEEISRADPFALETGEQRLDVVGKGWVWDTPHRAEVEAQIEHGVLGISIDADSAESDYIFEDPEGNEADGEDMDLLDMLFGKPPKERVTAHRIRAATLCPLAAFAETWVRFTDGAVVQPSLLSPQHSTDLEVAELVAGADLPWGNPPPLAHFQNPRLRGPTPFMVTADRQVFGHIGRWTDEEGSPACHIGLPGCTVLPRSHTNYAHFRLGGTPTAEGPIVPTGVITVGTVHAAKHLSPQATVAHYEHTGYAVADVAAGEDDHGVWVAGTLRPGATTEQVRTLMSAPPSGDWRWIGGNLELVAVLCVNYPGFPVPRISARVASMAGQETVTALVASLPIPRHVANRSAVSRAAIERIAASVGRTPEVRAARRADRQAALLARIHGGQR